MPNFFNNLIQQMDLSNKMHGLIGQVNYCSEILLNVVKDGGTIYIIGNGGSASDALHFSGELLGRFYKERKAIPCIALVSDIASITAIANDYGYGAIFERQLEGLFNPSKDILITMSTSGNSENIIGAINYVTKKDGRVINLLGKKGGRIVRGFPMASYDRVQNIIIPSVDTPRIQEMHMFILHFFAEYIEEGIII